VWDLIFNSSTPGHDPDGEKNLLINFFRQTVLFFAKFVVPFWCTGIYWIYCSVNHHRASNWASKNKGWIKNLSKSFRQIENKLQTAKKVFFGRFWRLADQALLDTSNGMRIRSHISPWSVGSLKFCSRCFVITWQIADSLHRHIILDETKKRPAIEKTRGLL